MTDKEILDLLDHYTKHGWEVSKTFDNVLWIIFSGNFGYVTAPSLGEAVKLAMAEQVKWATRG